MTTNEAIAYRINDIHMSNVLAMATYLQNIHPLMTRIDAIREAKILCIPSLP